MAPAPPVVPGVPFLGDGIPLFRDALQAFVDGYLTFGPVFRVRAPGRRYTILAGPLANDFMLRGGERHFDATAVYRRLVRELESTNYPVATTGARHRQLRRRCALE